jgi:hypothetical protein
MITSTNSATAGNSSTDFTLALPTSGASTSGSTDPFAQQLTSAIEQYLNQSGNGAASGIDIKIAQSQVSAGRQFTVTVTEPGTSGASETPATTSTSASASTPATGGTQLVTGISLMDAKPRSASEIEAATAATTAAASNTASTVSTTAAPVIDKSKMTPDDAYWAEQPAAVQALRNMAPEDVGQAAAALAKQGYTIDVPIMVWQWDPLTVMVERQNYGYTWVPSGLGTPVTLPPGLSFPGLTPYDPNNPPPGSIKVTTDFAKGTNMQDMFIDPATIQESFSGSTAVAS